MQKFAVVVLFLVASYSRVYAQTESDDLDFGLASIVAEEGDFTLAPPLESLEDLDFGLPPVASSLPEFDIAEPSLEAVDAEELETGDDDLDEAETAFAPGSLGAIGPADSLFEVADSGVGALSPNFLMTMAASLAMGIAALAVF